MNGKYLVFVGMGVELIGIMASCLYLGQIIDQQYQLQGIALAGLSLGGLAGWIIHIVLLIKRIDKNEESI